MKVWSIAVNVKRIVMQNGGYGNVYILYKLWKEIQDQSNEKVAKMCNLCS